MCELAKHKRVTFPVSNKMSTFPFYLVHTDVWGPSDVPNISDACWFVTFIDDCTRVTWVYLLKHTSEVSSVFFQFFSMIKNQFDVSIKRIRSDNAKDYFNHGLNSFCQKEGIIHESSCVKTPQQNGIAERKNGHLLDQTRANLYQNKIPKKYWGETVLTASYLINRLHSSVLDSKTPMEVLSSFYPDLSTSSNLTPRIFGCTSFVHIHSDGRGKLDPRALKCVFIGYSSTQKGYKCYHSPSHKFFVSRDVTFHEQESYFVQTHLQGENSCKEDESLLFPDLNLGPEVEVEIEGDNVETEVDSKKHVNVEADVRYGKNARIYTRRKTIHESTHIRESDPTLHEVTLLDPSNSCDSVFEFSHAHEP